VQERFRNRKNRISINVQAVVDSDMRFLNLVARWPGSVHDSRVFSNSELYCILEEGNIEGHLLGDAGYPCKTYFMTPLSKCNSPAEEKYQKVHVKTRNVIERTFGAWKRKFFCLSSKLRLKIDTSMAVIVACGVLWNFLLEQKDDEFAGEQIFEAEDERESTSAGDSSGFAKRRSLINNYFHYIYPQSPLHFR
ncbi:putative nuclease HARBI1-like protein, partial [Leptotrombidium deliense]